MKLIITIVVFAIAMLFLFLGAALLYECYLMLKRLFTGKKQEDISLFSWFNPFSKD